MRWSTVVRPTLPSRATIASATRVIHTESTGLRRTRVRSARQPISETGPADQAWHRDVLRAEDISGSATALPVGQPEGSFALPAKTRKLVNASHHQPLVGGTLASSTASARGVLSERTNIDSHGGGLAGGLAERLCPYEEVYADTNLKSPDVPPTGCDTQPQPSAHGTDCSQQSISEKSQDQSSRSGSLKHLARPTTKNCGTLTGEQVKVLQLVLDGASLFVGGKAGTGKSFLLREIAQRLTHSFGLRVAVTASTGVAAVNIDGNTFHSTFGVPVASSSLYLRATREGCDASRSSPLAGWLRPVRSSYCMSTRDGSDGDVPKVEARTLAGVDVIIVDEVSMLHAGYLEALERAARRAPGKNPKKPFGGIQVILSGDFMQLTPFRCEQRAPARFTRHSSPSAAADLLKLEENTQEDLATARVTKRVERPRRRRCPIRRYTDLPLYESYAFQSSLVHVQLSQPVRQSGDVAFVHELNQLRCGELPYRLSRCAHLNKADPTAIRLFAVKSAVKTFNEGKLLELKGEEHFFRSQIQLQAFGGNQPSPVGNSESVSQGDEPSAGNALSKHCHQTSLLHQHGSCGGRRRDTMNYSSAILLLHLSKRPRLRSLYSRQRSVSPTEANSTLAELYASAGFSSHEVVTYVVPFAFSRYAAQILTVGVRCLGRSRREAAGKLERLSKCAEALQRNQRTAHSQATEVLPLSERNMTRSRGRHASRPLIQRPVPERGVPRGSSLLELVRYESYSASQLATVLQPRLQRRFLGSVQHDVVLQSKRLKVGCRVMLLRNLNTKYVNGSLGTIVAFQPLAKCAALLPSELKAPLPRCHRAAVRQLTAHRKGKVGPNEAKVSEQRDASGDVRSATLRPSLQVRACQEQHTTRDQERKCVREVGEGQIKLPVVRMDADGRLVAIPWVHHPLPAAVHEGFFAAKVLCMPLTPAYAFTVHKIQGITLDHPVLFDAAGMFPCNHLVYVAASRVRRFAQLRWVNVSPRMITVHRPSLLFSNGIPGADEAAELWRAWKAHHAQQHQRTTRKGVTAGQFAQKKHLYFPNWRSEQ